MTNLTWFVQTVSKLYMKNPTVQIPKTQMVA